MPLPISRSRCTGPKDARLNTSSSPTLREPNKPAGAPVIAATSPRRLGGKLSEARRSLPGQLGQPLRSGRDHRRRKAHAGPPGSELAADALVVDAPERGLGVVAQPVLYLPGGLLVGQPGRKLQRHVYPRGDPGGRDEPAALDPPLADVRRPELLQHLVEGPMRGRSSALQQPHG